MKEGRTQYEGIGLFRYRSIMAVLKETHILHGCRGMIGKSLVFRMVNGKTVVSVAPVRKAPYTALQKQQQGKFKDAMVYARTRMNNPGLKARYVAMAKAQGGSTNPFNMAIREYFRIQKMKLFLKEIHHQLSVAMGTACDEVENNGKLLGFTGDAEWMEYLLLKPVPD